MFSKSKDFLVLMGQFKNNPNLMIDRHQYHEEELCGENELIESIMSDNRIGIADGLADLAYVITGTGALLGVEDGVEVNGDYDDLTLAKSIAWLSSLVMSLPVRISPHIDVVVIVGLLYRIAELTGVDLDAAFNIAHESNMSKATDDLEDAMDSIENYGFSISLNQVETDSGTRYVLRSETDDQPKYYRGKVLKPLSWSEPDFTPALINH